MATAYKANFDFYRAAGGLRPAQFVDTGYPSIWGNWALWPYPPGGQAPDGSWDNPVSRVTIRESLRSP